VVVTNNNMSVLIREYIPKGTDTLEDQGILNLIVDSMNTQPRKLLASSSSRRR
jgi:IS30 family transposase